MHEYSFTQDNFSEITLAVKAVNLLGLPVPPPETLDHVVPLPVGTVGPEVHRAASPSRLSPLFNQVREASVTVKRTAQLMPDSTTHSPMVPSSR